MVVLKCTHKCKPHKYQDKKYPNKRVYTENEDGEEVTCTVCGQRMRRSDA